ncbi:2-hydroxypropyl-CoM lyase [compost metagenome]
MLGAIDVANPRVETPEEVSETPRKALEYVDADKLIASTNCSMAPFPRAVSMTKLSALNTGAAVLREELAGTFV